MGGGDTDWKQVLRDREKRKTRQHQERVNAKSIAKRIEDRGLSAIVGDPVAPALIIKALRKYEPI